MDLSKYAIKGKDTRSQPDTTDVSTKLSDVPVIIRECYDDVEVLADAMHANNIQFLTRISANTHDGTINVVDNPECLTLEAELKNSFRPCTIREFRVVIILLDLKFKALKDCNIVGVLYRQGRACAQN